MSKTRVARVPLALVSECVLQTSAPESRIVAVPTNQITDDEMIVVREGAAWIGHVHPEDLRRVSLVRKGRRYVLADGEYELYRVKK